jgi:hypothetical protein
MPPIAFTDAQIEQIKLTGYQVPHHLRDAYLRRLVELLPRDHGDADVHRAAVTAQREILRAGERRPVNIELRETFEAAKPA